MAVIGGLLIFIGLAGLILGVVTLIYPIQRLRIPTRKMAGIVLGASFVVMIVGGAVTPTKDDKKAISASANTPAATTAAQAKQTLAAATTATAAAKDTPTPGPTDTPKAANTPQPAAAAVSTTTGDTPTSAPATSVPAPTAPR